MKEIKIGINEWKEITTKRIRVLDVYHKFSENSSVENWIKVNKKIGLYRGKRTYCACCHKLWKNISGDIICIKTDNGNKTICEECWDALQ